MSELAVVTTYFNPCRYRRRRAGYDLFIEEMRQAGVLCLTVECAFPGQDFELPDRLDIIKIRAPALLWQKERLINLGVSWLPPRYRYVAWLDCDILFDNPNWHRDTVDLLSRYAVVQMFETCDRMGPDGEGGYEAVATSFAKITTAVPSCLDVQRYDAHGHTGYGWAMRREIFDRVGLYEAAVSGSADHFMAHAIFGNYGFCIENALKHDRAQIAHLKEWGGRFHAMVNGNLGCVPGRIRHVWHGDAVNRRYFLRMHEITALGFNPWTDIVAAPGEPLAWANDMNKPELEAYFAAYFAARREDESCARLAAA